MNIIRIFTLSLGLMLISHFLTGQNNDLKNDTTERRIKFKHAINTCPGGVAFGIFSVNYEYLLNAKHGLVLRADYEHIPGTYSDAKIDAYGAAVILNYRYHFNQQMNSYFAGAFSRARIYKGDGQWNNETVDFSLPEITLGVNLGRRWVWNSGINVTFSLGYGYTFKKKNIGTDDAGFEAKIEDFEKKYNFSNSFLGELSIGYAF
ncbi:MAG: DUF3575 domain-containing protein [Lentimicrobiaceae bacterium]|nr:DUF3575 domain-containing protein [Lentimicrobiaceae bacterium]